MQIEDHGRARGIVLFVTGLAMVIAGSMLLLPVTPRGQALTVFAVIDLVVLYAIVLGPPLVGYQADDFDAARIVSYGIAWRAVAPYAALTAVVLAVAYTNPLVSLPALVVVQLAGLFVLALYSHFGQVSERCVRDVERRQRAQRASVDSLRTFANGLSVRVAQRLGPGELADLCARIAEELRFLAPVNTEEAFGYEDKIMARLTGIDAALATGDAAYASSSQVIDLAREVQSLIRERKTLRS